MPPKMKKAERKWPLKKEFKKQLKIREQLQEQEDRRKERKTIKGPCFESLSSVCGVCSHMIVEPTTHLGCACTKSRCSRGFWEGGNSWNRLYQE